MLLPRQLLVLILLLPLVLPWECCHHADLVFLGPERVAVALARIYPVKNRIAAPPTPYVAGLVVYAGPEELRVYMLPGLGYPEICG